jgi:predicted transcriptional regulator
MFKNEILENENRKKIYSAVDSNPGIHVRELQRVLGMPLMTLDYHLNYMARKGIIFGETGSHYKRYYAKPLDAGDKKVVCALRQKKLRDIVTIVLVNEKAKCQFLADNLKLPRSTLSFYLKCLVENDILKKDKIGYENIYTVQDEEKVTRLLAMHKSSFAYKIVEKALRVRMKKVFGKKLEA